jgi:hypothetical protein
LHPWSISIFGRFDKSSCSCKKAEPFGIWGAFYRLADASRATTEIGFGEAVYFLELCRIALANGHLDTVSSFSMKEEAHEFDHSADDDGRDRIGG